jgi:hypothetical protein
MSGHGKREAILKADATSWRDRVYPDIAAEAGQLALIEHRLLAPIVLDVVNTIASRLASGGDLVIVRPRARRRPVVDFLAARGHVEMRGHLVRPVIHRDGELFG